LFVLCLDELDDGGFDSGEEEDYYYEDMTREQQVEMSTSLQQVLSILPQPQTSLESEYGISLKQIKNSLWDSYFDVESTVDYYLELINKKELNKRKEKGNISSTTTFDAAPGIENEMEKLSIQVSPPPTTTKPKLSKLSSKIAQSKLSKSSSSSSSSTSTPTHTPTPTLTKPLSKLQQKMLLKQQQQIRESSTSSTSTQTQTQGQGTESTSPILNDTTTATITTSTTEEAEEEEEEVDLNEFKATPSLFANSLLPPPSSSSFSNHIPIDSPSTITSTSQQTPAGGGGGGGGKNVELAKHLAKSINININNFINPSSGGGGGGAAWGLSPDDKVLEARKGTALSSSSSKSSASSVTAQRAAKR